MKIKITAFHGYAPVQAWGYLDNLPFYFRARWDYWRFQVGDSPVEDVAEWAGTDQNLCFELAGFYENSSWMDLEHAKILLKLAISAYKKYDKEMNKWNLSKKHI